MVYEFCKDLALRKMKRGKALILSGFNEKSTYPGMFLENVIIMDWGSRLTRLAP